jgi:hypothetical protein
MAEQQGVLSQETAAEQVRQLLAYYEFNAEHLPQAMRAALESSVAQIEQGVRLGLLEIDISAERCEVKQHLKRPVPGASNPIVYREVSGKAKIGIREDGGNYGKMYAFLGALSGEGAAIYLNMKSKDLSLAEALGALFLQV